MVIHSIACFSSSFASVSSSLCLANKEKKKSKLTKNKFQKEPSPVLRTSSPRRGNKNNTSKCIESLKAAGEARIKDMNEHKAYHDSVVGEINKAVQ